MIDADPQKTFLFDTGDSVCVVPESGKESSIDDLRESLEYLSLISAGYKYAVQGNHDKAHTDSEKIASLYKDSGFVYTDKLGLVVPGPRLSEVSSWPFLILTAPDFTTRQEDWYSSLEADQFIKTLENLPANQLTLLLTHNPSMIDTWQGGRVANILKEKKVIVFSGHTHGGQLNTTSPIQNLAMIVGREAKNYDSKLIKGIYRMGSSIVNVNSGVGYFKGIRTLQPSFDVFEFRR